MRTTLRIDDDVLAAARSLADAEGQSVGQVISALARRGLEPRRATQRRKGFPVFVLGPDAPPLTPEMVLRALDEE